jgi:hypothetical protein
MRSAALKGRVALVAGGLAVLLAAAGAMRADLIVSHGFAKAFGTQAAVEPLDIQRTAKAQGLTQVGDEGYWLTRSEVESPAPFDKGLAVGDRIHITGRDGRERNLEVVDLRVIGEPIVRTVEGTAPVRLLLVTCHIVNASGDRDDKTPVRFIIEGDTEPAPARTAVPKA